MPIKLFSDVVLVCCLNLEGACKRVCAKHRNLNNIMSYFRALLVKSSFENFWVSEPCFRDGAYLYYCVGNSETLKLSSLLNVVKYCKYQV